MPPTDLACTIYSPPAAAAPWSLQDVVGHDRLRYFSLGRWALVEALRIAGVAAGDAVLLPGCLCREVVASVAALGASPIYYEVGPGLAPVKAHVDWPHARAVVAVDFFGFPQDLGPFQEYCWRTSAVLIEDNAHGLLSRDSAGRALGARAALGVFSLRKTLPLPDGGALAINDASLLAKVPAQSKFLERPAGRRGLLRALAPWLGARGTWGCISLGRKLRALRGGSELPPADPEGEEVIPQPPEPCAELGRPLDQIDPEREAQRRRQLYAFCAELLAGTGAAPVFPELPRGASPYVYPFRASGAAAEKAERALNAHGLFSLPWPDLPRAVVANAPRHYHDIRGAHFLW